MVPKVLVILVLILNYTLSCEPEISGISKCATIQDLEEVKSEIKSTIVYIGNSDVQELTTINNDTFNNIPFVETLSLIGVVNKIEQNPFRNLRKLQKLYFENDEINIITSNLFENSTILELRILNCSVEDILPGSFDYLEKISIVTIENNNIPTIKTNVFTNTRIITLDLTGNKIQFIENNAFYGMNKLEILILKKNDLTLFDSKLLLGTNPSLQILDLNENKLKSFTKDTFDEIENLQELLIGNNEINTLSENCFHTLENLNKLDLSNNKIEEISPDLFPKYGLRSLKQLYLHENHLCFLDPEFFKRVPNLRTISFGGNPWQCPCWFLLNKWIMKNNIYNVCHEQFLTGQRPECIVTEFSECVYDKEKLKSLRRIFHNETAYYRKVTNCV